MKEEPKIQAVIEIPPNLSVATDKKSGTQFVSFPFRFPDGVNGNMVIMKLTSIDPLTKKVNNIFLPSQDIEAILIQFKS